MSELTEAQRERRDDLDNYPSRGGVAKVTKAWKLLNHQSWITFKAQYEALRSTVQAVVGRYPPIAKTIRYPDGSTYVQINDGLVEHLEAVSRIIAAGSRAVEAGGIVTEKPACSPVEVDELLRQVYQQWKARENLERIEPLTIRLGPIAEQIADSTFRASLVFTILHEFGHAASRRGLPRDPLTQEPEADRWAAVALLSTAVAAVEQPNYLLGGALLSIRALASKEAVSKSDLHGYPPSGHRFSALVETARQFFPGELVFYMKTTVAFTHDMRLQRAEHDLGSEREKPPSRPEQFVSTIVAMLVEVAESRMTLPTAIETIVGLFVGVPAEVISATAEICRRVFDRSQPAYDQYEDCNRIIDLFIELAPQLPETT